MGDQSERRSCLALNLRRAYDGTTRVQGVGSQSSGGRWVAG